MCPFWIIISIKLKPIFVEIPVTKKNIKLLHIYYKGKYFFLGEFDCVDDDEYQKMPYPDRIHFLFYQHVIHPLTWQGLGFKEDWLEIFKNAEIEVVKMEDKLNFRLVQFILKF